MNIVLLMTDQQSASALPMYGNPIVRAPHLTRFAEEGCLFTRAFTSCPLCVPARVSAFTGQYPSTHGSLDNNVLMQPGRDHFLRLLKEAGYATALVGKNHCFTDEDLALFDRFDECSHYGPVTTDERYLEVNRFLGACRDLKGCWTCTLNPFSPERLGTHWITDRAIEFVAEDRSEPFFLWYSIADPHIPFQAAESYASMYPPEAVDLPPFKAEEMAGKPRAQQMDHAVMCGDKVSKERIRRIRSIYYAMNTFVDDEVGRFLAALGHRGLSENTLIIYVSDHGEYLGEHRMIRKSKSAYDCLTHVPFIVRGPGVVSGACSDAFVGLEDINPTVLGAVGLPIPSGTQGRDLGPILRGESFEGRGFAYGEYGGHVEPWPVGRPFETCRAPDSPDFSPRKKVGGYGKMRYLRTDRWKLVVYVNDTWELYDLANDPAELENLYGRPDTAEVAARLTDLLLEQVMRLSNPGVWPGAVS